MADREPTSPGRRRAAAVLAALGWFAILLQLDIMLRNAAADGTGMLAAVGSFLSFFTVLSNLLVTAGLAGAIPALPPRALRPLVVPPGAAALAGYITIVGIVYSLLLRELWEPTGAQRLADVLLHDVMPVAYVLYWLAFVPKGHLTWRHAWLGLVYPAAYTVASLARGALLQVYPYPFIDVRALGYPQALGNILLLALGFLAVGLVYVGIDRVLGRATLPPVRP